MSTSNVFCQMVRASGQGEAWNHHLDGNVKFGQFGWRSTTSENGYKNGILVGNWSEDRFDISKRKTSKPLSSQYGHYFENSYDIDFNKPQQPIPNEIRNLKRRHPNSFPGHQPEFDTPECKAYNNSWQTTSSSAYRNPFPQKYPVSSQRQMMRAPSSAQAEPVPMKEAHLPPIKHLGARSVSIQEPMDSVVRAPHSGPGVGKGPL